MAKARVQMNASTFAGPMTIFSFLLGDDRLSRVPKAKNAAISHIPVPAHPEYCTNARPDREATTAAKINSITIWNSAAILRGSGNLPGCFPPRVYSPKGAPNARAIWNMIMNKVSAR